MPLIPDEIVSQVLDRCDIVEVVSNYVTLKKAGRNFKGLSPFNHEKTPSFIVSPDKQIFHCFSSGIGGNVISFVMRIERLEFPQAVRMLAKKVNVEIPEISHVDAQQRSKRENIFEINALAADYYHNVLLSDKEAFSNTAREYLKNRGITQETALKFKLGLSKDSWDGLIQYLKTKNISLRLMEEAGLIIARENKEGYYDRFRKRIIYPIFDTQGRVRAFGARALDDSGAKYINSPETEVYTKGDHLYGFHLAKNTVAQKDFIVIAEGYMDCIIPQQAGFGNIVASLGTALTTQQVRNLRRFSKNVTLLYDSDSAGEAAMMRSFDMLIEEDIDVKVASLASGEDPDSFIRKYGMDDFNSRISEAQGLFDYKLERLCKVYDSTSVNGKAKICDEMLPTINRFKHAVKQEGYISRLAEALGVSKPILHVELNKIREGIRKPAHEAPKVTKKVEGPPKVVESSLLKLILDEKNYIRPTKEEISLEDFTDTKIKLVIEKIYDLFDQGVEFSSRDLINSLDDQETVQLISRLETDEKLIIGDKDKIHRDCMNRIKNDRLKKYRKELLVKMKEAETIGDLTRLDQLKEQFNQSIKN